MAVVTPTLALAVSSIAAGALGERIGRRRLLEISTALFSVTAILPFWLDSFPMILMARAIAGVALGAMSTSGIGLTGDYFSGASRERWLAIQGGAGAGAGVVTAAIAGALGDIDWRLPFLLLGVGFPLLAALLLLPPRVTESPASAGHDDEAKTGPAGRLPWMSLAAIFALAIFGSLIIFPPAFELGLVFQEKRLGAATLTGLATAVLAGGGVAGALGVGVAGRLSAPGKMAVAFAVAGLGMALVSWSSQIPPIMIGAAAVGVGQGIISPVLSIWLLDRTPAAARGRVVGLYTTVFGLAQFAAPMIAGWIAAYSTSTSASMIYYEIASAAAVAMISALCAIGAVKAR
jgi:MFS family permease